MVALGADVDADAAKATYEDGMLTVELPIRRPPGRARSRSAARTASRDRDRHPGRGRGGGRDGRAARAARALPVLPLRDTVTFPDTLTPLAVGQERSIRLVNDVLGGDRMLAMVASRDPELESPGPDQLHDVGVVGTVARMLKVPDGTLRILVQAGPRVGSDRLRGRAALPRRARRRGARRAREGPELTALVRNVQQTFSRIIEDVPYLPEELQLAVANLEDPSALAHLIAGALRIKTEEKQALLEELDVGRGCAGSPRSSRASSRSSRSARGSSRRSSPSSTAPSASTCCASSSRRSRRSSASATRPRPRSRSCASSSTRSRCPRTCASRPTASSSRLEKLPQAAAEHGVIRTYLEWIASLPWDKTTEDNLDLAHAREVLDADHYDIEKVKDRILEFLAVRKLKPDAARLDPLLRRPARRGQDVARPVDRARAGPQVRAHQRSAACATRPRSAATAAPTSARCPARSSGRCATRARQPAVHDRRDRQDGRRLPRRPGERRCSRCSTPSRTRPSATTTSTCRSTSRRVMFITTANTLDTVPGRCATAWR